MPTPTSPQNLARLLASVLDPARVLGEEEARRAYFDDLTEIPGALPAVVVKARAVEEVRAVLAVARQTGASVTPVVAGMNVGGLAIPCEGGIVLDLKEMNQVLRVDDDEMYALIEPGVTWEQLKRALDHDHPQFCLGYTLAPPDTSVVANCLMDGLTTLSLRTGATSNWINGLEVVLPDGEVARTGIGLISPSWCTRSPMPDLTGLFVNTHGTTGIVTKMAVKVFPRPKYRSRLFLLAYTVRDAYALIRRVMREDICSDAAALSWPVGKLLFGLHGRLARDPAEPLLFTLYDVTANFENDFRCKVANLRALIRDQRRAGARLDGPLDLLNLVALEPRFAKFADMPARLDFLLNHPGKGLTWVGTYGPTARWEEGVERGFAIMERHGFAPILVSRPMDGGHFGVLRLIALFNKRDPADARRVAAMNTEVADMLVSLGYFPYKSPAWVVERYRGRMDPGFLHLFSAVRRALDPFCVLNRGKWPLSEGG
ncbi:MAG: FAD-binding oxidoreductase [Planctomycetes bacterium]|nr:FAD-binding oxidoreductase [Planctomycetota bacterium]